jgi:two-component system response regulator HydG
MEKVLLVEDEKETAAMIAKFLQRKGFDVDIAHDLAGGMNRFLPYYNIVLLDIKLDGENSFPLLKKIKSECPECLVIMVSAHDTDENIIQAKQLGADGFIAKPIVSENLENFLLSKIHSLRHKPRD